MNERRVTIDYTSHKGNRSTRQIIPLGELWFDKTPWHPENQWLVRAYCLRDKTIKLFAMSGIHSWTPDPDEPI